MKCVKFKIKKITSFILIFLLQACHFGPKYEIPKMEIPAQYKEAKGNWKTAEPRDHLPKGNWWQIFNNPELTKLLEEAQLSNQELKIIEAQYRQAKALIDQARAGYFPVINHSISITRQKSPGSSGGGQSANNTGNNASSGAQSGGSRSSPLSTIYSTGMDASWEPDLWGSVSGKVSASKRAAEAKKAEWSSLLLSIQGTIAQSYYELASLDEIQKLLNENLKSYQKLKQIMQNRYNQGAASRLELVQAENLLKQAEVRAIDNGANRAQFEHAIAVLVGKAPSDLTLDPQLQKLTIPRPPLDIPSQLLERRPDIAQSERLVAQANAEIGIAIAAFFPVLRLTAKGGFTSNKFKSWFSYPSLFWSVGSELATNIFDGGLKGAKVTETYARYDETVAQYRQTVLSAFQEVEDNLSTLRILSEEAQKQETLVANTRQLLRLVQNEYDVGTVPFSDVINAYINLSNEEINLILIATRRLTATAGLIKALGGGWDKEVLEG